MCISALMAQRYGRGRRGGEGWIPEDAAMRSAGEVPTHRYDMPEWTNSPAFKKDVFTFVRAQYRRGPSYAWRACYCFTDFPVRDVHFSYPLLQVTSLQVGP